MFIVVQHSSYTFNHSKCIKPVCSYASLRRWRTPRGASNVPPPFSSHLITFLKPVYLPRCSKLDLLFTDQIFDNGWSCRNSKTHWPKVMAGIPFSLQKYNVFYFFPKIFDMKRKGVIFSVVKMTKTTIYLKVWWN